MYSDDPQKNKSAVPVTDTTWDEFLKIIPSEWSPGLSAPFDPIAARTAKDNDIEVAIVNGLKLDELEHYIDGKEFVGTRIHN